MRPLWNMKKWLELADDYKWVVMVGLDGLWKLHWVPIREDLLFVFLLGLRKVDDVRIKSKLLGQTVEITRQVISEMLIVPHNGPDTEWSNPTQLGLARRCRNFVDETVKSGKEGTTREAGTVSSPAKAKPTTGRQ